MTDTTENTAYNADAVTRIIDICRKVKNKYVRHILLDLKSAKSASDEYYEDSLAELDSDLRTSASGCLDMMHRVANLAFLYIISKYTSIGMTVTSNCEARIDQAVANLYNAYNASDDVVQYVILNVALGLDASADFLNKFELIASRNGFYKNTDEYINMFKHMQELERGSFKTKSLTVGSAEWLYKLLKKLEFVCDLDIVMSDDYYDCESQIMPCAFVLDGKTYPSKYALIKYSPNEYNDLFMFLRSIDEIGMSNGEKSLRLNYTKMSVSDSAENFCAMVTSRDFDYPRDRLIKTNSIGIFYSYITGDLLRKRHRMSFCNGLSSYKYYGELVASITDAFEKIIADPDKRYAVVENFILPVIKSNFNICKEECVCLGTGCPYVAGNRPCNNERYIDVQKDLNAGCVSNMDVVSILTILFSVVGCKEILPQIFSRYDAGARAFDVLFDTVNEQLEKRFSEFKSERVTALRKEFYKKSIDYLSLNLDENKCKDAAVEQTLRPFKIRAYTDALIVVLENLDRDGTDGKVVNPSGNVYSIRNKIELVRSLNDINGVRKTLRDTLKVILTYYSGLANCKRQQLTYEIKAEQTTALAPDEVKECERNIEEAFKAGVKNKLDALGKDPSFFTLFKALIDDTENLKNSISIMLGRELVNVSALKRFIALDEKNSRCFLVEKRKKENGGAETVYECDLDDETQSESGEAKQKFVSRVVDLLRFFNGEDSGSIRFACYPQVLTHTSSRVNVDNTTINAFTAYESEQYIPQKEYNVITYFSYEISKRYFYIAPKKFEKTRWITYPILVRCSDFYDMVFRGHGNE